MQIASEHVVEIHYTLWDANTGEELETTRGEQPMAYLHAAGSMPDKVEAELNGKVAGDHVDMTLTAEEAFGERKEGSFQRLSKKYFKHLGKIRAGEIAPVQTEHGPRMVTILKVGHSAVDVDLNHPYAGRALKYSVDVVSVRPASKEELEHGHAHGPGGHHH